MPMCWNLDWKVGPLGCCLSFIMLSMFGAQKFLPAVGRASAYRLGAMTTSSLSTSSFHGSRSWPSCTKRAGAKPERLLHHGMQCFALTTSRMFETSLAGDTVREVLHQSKHTLEIGQVPEPESSVTQLLAKALHLSWSNGFSQLRRVLDGFDEEDNLGNRVLTEEEWIDFEGMLRRRWKHEPLQYILGRWDFLDYTFQIRAPLLCPRPETEELVQLIADDIIAELRTGQSTRILDVGSGTGCIGVSLAALLPGAQVVAMDVEPIAIETSQANAERILGSRSESSYRSVLCSVADYVLDRDEERFDVVVSNPPYIPLSDMENLGAVVSEYESQTALCGGEDGMDVIRDIVRCLPRWTRPGAACWMEVDPTHPKLLREWLQEGNNLGVSFESSHSDLYEHERFVKLRVTK